MGIYTFGKSPFKSHYPKIIDVQWDYFNANQWENLPGKQFHVISFEFSSRKVIHTRGGVHQFKRNISDQFTAQGTAVQFDSHRIRDYDSHRFGGAFAFSNHGRGSQVDVVLLNHTDPCVLLIGNEAFLYFFIIIFNLFRLPYFFLLPAGINSKLRFKVFIRNLNSKCKLKNSSSKFKFKT